MKKSLISLFWLIGIPLVFLAFSSCSDDDVTTSELPEEISSFTGLTSQDLSDIEVVDSAQISYYEHYNKILQEASAGNSEEDEMWAEYARKQLVELDSLTQAVIDEYGANGEIIGEDGKSDSNNLLSYKYVTLRYNSVDAWGKPVRLSELVVWPYNRILPNPHPAGVMIGCHITITSNKERPTNYYNNSWATDVGQMATLVGATDYLGVIPDYQGYGATHGDPHPYLYQSLTARQVMDGVEAAKTWYEANEKSFANNWKSFSIGYSQGGSVALAVHQYIVENNLGSKYNFLGSICGDGPYDPVATVREYISTGQVYMPVAGALILKGIVDCNPYVRDSYKIEDYLTSEFLASGIIDWLKSKDYTTDDIQDKLCQYSMDNSNGFYMMRKSGSTYYPYTPENKGKSWEKLTTAESAYCDIDQVLRPEVIEYLSTGKTSDEYKAKCEALYKALEMNSLAKLSPGLGGYTAVCFHSTKDEVVPFVNLASLFSTFSSNLIPIKYMCSSTYSHVGTGTAFFLNYQAIMLNYLDKSLGNAYSSFNYSDGYYYTTGTGLGY